MIREFKGRHAFLSNFYACRIPYKDRFFQSSETAYMSEKSNDDVWKDHCAASTMPGVIKKESRHIRLIPEWDLIRLQVMEDVLRIKFSNPQLCQLLLETGYEELCEWNDWGDRFWGVDKKTGEGLNNLGLILMKIRKELQDKHTI